MADADSVPDVYADQFIVTPGVWGVNLSFLKNTPHPTPGQTPSGDVQVTVRMSLEHAKAMTLIMRRQLKQFEREVLGTEIVIPQQVYGSLGVSPEDW